MKTLEDLWAFYQASLIGALQELEGKRKNIANSLIFGMIIAGVVLIAAAIIMPGAFLFLLVILLAVYGIMFQIQSKDFVSEFKLRIIKEIVEFIDSGLDYQSGNFIPEHTYMASEIFKTHPDRYRGKDYVSGKIGATAIEFSQIHSEYKTEHIDRNGRRRTQWHTIFKGIFFIGDFNKNFQGRTVVLPDTAEKLLGVLGTSLQSMNVTRGQLIKMEDPEFEKMFVVYGDDQVEARYLLSTSLLERIVNFRKKSGANIFISFVRSKIFVAVDHPQDIFEPRIFKTLIDFAPIQEYFEHLTLVLGIVDDLNLNTRIWLKQ